MRYLTFLYYSTLEVAGKNLDARISELELDSSEAVLAVFGVNRFLYGLDNSKKSYHWWNKLYEQRQRDIGSAKTDL
jgi:hypothetical protein